ncbi:HAD-IIIA family hydrolase [Patescibacteria group bacterium]|nr:HAD-IIIA family hydrolase [Patescibacteria group bacterium]
MQLKLVVFDFDGTLADTFSYVIKYLKKITIKEGIDVDLENNEFIEEMMNYHVRDLLKRFNISLVRVPKILREVRRVMYKDIDEIEMFEGMKDALAEMKNMGLDLGILTSNSKRFVETFLKSKDAAQFFDFVHSEGNLFGKDRVLKKLVKKTGLKKSEVVYVGDEARDIEACKKAGITCISVEWGFNNKYALDEHEADYIVDSPEELLLKIKYLNEMEGREQEKD